MRRNHFGINLDEGLALSSNADFSTLYIDIHKGAKAELEGWFERKDSAICLGGQLGCGKSTLIESLITTGKYQPDLVFHFDKSSLNLSSVDSWCIVFVIVLKWLIEFDLTAFIPDIFFEHLGATREEKIYSLTLTSLNKVTSEALSKRKGFLHLLDSMEDYLPKIFNAIIQDVENKIKRKIMILALGIDKFGIDTPGYFSIRPVMECLSEYKTLFEVNAVHLFSNETWIGKTDKCFITSISTEEMSGMLKKRLGAYWKSYEKDLIGIVSYSGGIPRQGIRLLDYFITSEKFCSNKLEALLKSIEYANKDFFAFSELPSNVFLKTVDKDQTLESTLVSLPGDKETAAKAVFGNWIIIENHLSESKWKARLNPLIKGSIKSVTPNEPESRILHDYAIQSGISDYGLEIDPSNELFKHTLLSEIESTPELNIVETLNVLKSALLSKDRADLTIIAFKNEEICNIIRSYFQAKSNSFEIQRWAHVNIVTGSDFSPLEQIVREINNKEIDIVSIQFPENLDNNDLDEINIRRDSFIEKQMLWWIPYGKLNNYLKRWTQLRQLFKIIVLEEDVSKTLSIEDLESDIEFMKDLAEDENSAPYEYIKNLKFVIDFLKGEAHG